MDPFWDLANSTQKWGQYWILLMLVHCYVLVARLPFNPPETTTSWTEMRPARETLHWLNHHKDHDCRFLTSRNCAATWGGFRTLVPSLHTPPCEKEPRFQSFYFHLLPKFHHSSWLSRLECCNSLARHWTWFLQKVGCCPPYHQRNTWGRKKVHLHVFDMFWLHHPFLCSRWKKLGGGGGKCRKFKSYGLQGSL